MNKILLVVFSFVITFTYWNIVKAENILSYTYSTDITASLYPISPIEEYFVLTEFLWKNQYRQAFELKKSWVSYGENPFFQKNKSSCLSLLQIQKTWDDLRNCLAFWTLLAPEDPELPHFFYRETQQDVSEKKKSHTTFRVWWEDSDNAFVRYTSYDKRFDLSISFGKFTSDLEYHQRPRTCDKIKNIDELDFPPACEGYYYLSQKGNTDPHSWIPLAWEYSRGVILKGDASWTVYHYILRDFYDEKWGFRNESTTSHWLSSPMNVAYYRIAWDEGEGSSPIFYTEPLDQNLYNQVLPLVRKLLLKSGNSESMKEQLKTMFTSCRTHGKTSALQLVCRKILSEELSK